MVNAAATADRRAAPRADSGPAFGGGKLNPFGDLHTLQHLSARLARSMRGVFEPLLRQDVRCWAEPLAVQRFADYRAERADTLSAWLPMDMRPAGAALLVLDGTLVLEMLDLFFGGNGAVPQPMPTELSPAAEAMVTRLGTMLAAPLRSAWEPLAKVEFTPGVVENSSSSGIMDGDDAAIVTRFGIAAGTAKPVFVDILYPVAALKPHTTALTGNVLDKPEPDPAWRNGLTRTVMGVKFRVRSVLAEPVVPLSMLMDLKPGDVIPISFGPNVPVMVGDDCLGAGTVGTSNGHAAIRLTSLARVEGSDA